MVCKVWGGYRDKERKDQLGEKGLMGANVTYCSGLGMGKKGREGKIKEQKSVGLCVKG